LFFTAGIPSNFARSFYHGKFFIVDHGCKKNYFRRCSHDSFRAVAGIAGASWPAILMPPARSTASLINVPLPAVITGSDLSEKNTRGLLLGSIWAVILFNLFWSFSTSFPASFSRFVISPICKILLRIPLVSKGLLHRRVNRVFPTAAQYLSCCRQRWQLLNRVSGKQSFLRRIGESAYSRFMRAAAGQSQNVVYACYFIFKTERIKRFRDTGGKRNNPLRRRSYIYTTAYFISYRAGARYVWAKYRQKTQLRIMSSLISGWLIVCT